MLARRNDCHPFAAWRTSESCSLLPVGRLTLFESNAIAPKTVRDILQVLKPHSLPATEVTSDKWLGLVTSLLQWKESQQLFLLSCYLVPK